MLNFEETGRPRKGKWPVESAGIERDLRLTDAATGEKRPIRRLLERAADRRAVWAEFWSALRARFGQQPGWYRVQAWILGILVETQVLKTTDGTVTDLQGWPLRPGRLFVGTDGRLDRIGAAPKQGRPAPLAPWERQVFTEIVVVVDDTHELRTLPQGKALLTVRTFRSLRELEREYPVQGDRWATCFVWDALRESYRDVAAVLRAAGSVEVTVRKRTVSETEWAELVRLAQKNERRRRKGSALQPVPAKFA